MPKKHKAPTPGGNVQSSVSAERLKSFVKRIEKLNEDKSSVSEDLREVYSEAKSAGFSNGTIRQIVRERAMDTEKRREAQELLDLYKSALGMLDD